MLRGFETRVSVWMALLGIAAVLLVASMPRAASAGPVEDFFALEDQMSIEAEAYAQALEAFEKSQGGKAGAAAKPPRPKTGKQGGTSSPPPKPAPKNLPPPLPINEV